MLRILRWIITIANGIYDHCIVRQGLDDYAFWTPFWATDRHYEKLALSSTSNPELSLVARCKDMEATQYKVRALEKYKKNKHNILEMANTL